jgi:hypothetical protein
MRRLPLIALSAFLAAPALAAPSTYVAPLAPARDLPPAGSVTAIFDDEAGTLRFVIQTAAGALAPGEHQLHLHANYEGNAQIGQPLPAQVKALPPATTDDIDGDGVIELFEAVPLIGESWWTIDTVTVDASGALNFDRTFTLDRDVLEAPDELTLASPGVSGPQDLDFPNGDIDNVGFFRSALANFGLLAFDIHGAPDPAGVGNTPGEVDEDDGYEALRPALGGAFVLADTDVPEPGMLGLLGLGVLGLAASRRRRTTR